MKENDAEYKYMLNEFVREQYQIADPKPSGMMGHWGWRIRKEREFREQMISKGLLEKEKEKK